ncbi:hypothetical protein MIMGU_mgv11b015226mg, partial [Erythranthe guttata]
RDDDPRIERKSPNQLFHANLDDDDSRIDLNLLKRLSCRGVAILQITSSIMSPPSITIFFLIILSLNFCHESEAMRRHLIKNFNRMREGTPALSVHCASKKDDLGYRHLYTGQYFNWSFRSNFWGNTLFFYRF